MSSEAKIRRYRAAGGVVIHQGKVLVLYRRNPDEVRLPKGHIDPGETAVQAAVREVQEETGYQHLSVTAELGKQTVEFDHKGAHFIRKEWYYVMQLDSSEDRNAGEAQFKPVWLDWDQALREITFEAERVWLERARRAARPGPNEF
jgi:8-oxo-dGTP pyrophosphatase MutT (NUDIX family)